MEKVVMTDAAGLLKTLQGDSLTDVSVTSNYS